MTTVPRVTPLQQQPPASPFVRAAALGFTVVAGLAILAATLEPSYSGPAPEWSTCLICGERGLAEVLLNVLLFAPLGVGLILLRLPPVRAVLIGGLLSAAIEATQLVLPGRDPSLGDVLFNTLGAGLGIGVALLTPHAARLSARTAARLAFVTALVIAAIVATTGWLLTPSFPTSDYWVRCGPSPSFLEWCRGRVRKAMIGDLPIHAGRLEDAGAVRAALARGDPIALVAVAGPGVSGLGHVFNIADPTSSEFVIVGPDGADLVFWYRMRATDLRLDQPDIRFPGAWRAVRTHDVLTVRTWGPSKSGYCGSVSGQTACVPGMSVGRGWGLLYYLPTLPEPYKRLLDGLWIAILTVPVGFFMRRRWEALLAIFTILAALAAVPRMLNLGTTSPWLLVAAAASVGATWFARARLLRPRA